MTEETITSFSPFAAKSLQEMAAGEKNPLRKAQIETAALLYGHLASGSIPTRASSRGTAAAMGVPVEHGSPKSLDQYFSVLLNKPDIEVLNIGDPYLMTADKRVTVLDPVILAEKPEGAKVVKGVFPATPFTSESFDAIVCKNSLGYPMRDMQSEQVKIVFDELLRLTKKDGMIFINAIEFDFNDHDNRAFSNISSVLDTLKAQGVLDYEYDRELDEAEAVGSTPPAATTWYTLRIKKISNYTPQPFPSDILEPIAHAYNQGIARPRDRKPDDYKQASFLPHDQEHSSEENSPWENRSVSLEDFLSEKNFDLRPTGFTPERMQSIEEILKKATEHASRLKGAKVVSCDVCVGQFISGQEWALELGGRIFAESMNFESNEMTPQVLAELYPEWDTNASKTDGRVRVHGFDEEGRYVTYCHFCDSSMCLSQVKEGPEWEKQANERYGSKVKELFDGLSISFIPQKEFDYLVENIGDKSIQCNPLPAEPLMYYIASASAWNVNIEILVAPGMVDREFVKLAHDGKEFIIHVDTVRPWMSIDFIERMYKPITDQVPKELYRQLSLGLKQGNNVK